jgi:hypothetical protein
MSCCSTDRHEFVMAKVRNMKAWLNDWTSPELAAMYDESKVVGMIATGLLPLYAAGKLDEGVEEVLRNLVGVPDAEVEGVRLKVKRYLTCFCEALV